jgi:hypothetical protein
MSGEHLNPNRGWTLIRDGGRFTSAEVAHLKDCEQCSEWLSLFADLARNAGFKPDLDGPFFFIAEDRHLTAGRAWALIRDGGQLTLPETGHLHYCQVCNEWLSKFAAAARTAGFVVLFEIPPCDSQRGQKAG